MKLARMALLGAALLTAYAPGAFATVRNFTYTYEPETMPQGELEFENWTTFRSTRNDAVGQNHYTRWDLRQELEYGVTDNWQLSFYLNEKSEYSRNPSTHAKTTESEFEGVSFENKWLVVDPAKSPIGVALYLEPTIGNGEFELEEKIILGQRFGKDKNWKWAFNVSHATEWEDSDKPGEGTETEGELEFDLGITREMNKRWNLGLELRNHNEYPEYEEREHSAFFIGPVLTYRAEKWWATFTFLTQFYGDNNQNPDPDGNPNLVLDAHERYNARLIVGIDF